MTLDNAIMAMEVGGHTVAGSYVSQLIKYGKTIEGTNAAITTLAGNIVHIKFNGLMDKTPYSPGIGARGLHRRDLERVPSGLGLNSVFHRRHEPSIYAMGKDRMTGDEARTQRYPSRTFCATFSVRVSPLRTQRSAMVTARLGGDIRHWGTVDHRCRDSNALLTEVDELVRRPVVHGRQWIHSIRWSLRWDFIALTDITAISSERCAAITVTSRRLRRPKQGDKNELILQ